MQLPKIENVQCGFFHNSFKVPNSWIPKQQFLRKGLNYAIDINLHFCDLFPKPCYFFEFGRPKKNSHEEIWNQGNDVNPVPGFISVELLLVVDADL